MKIQISIEEKKKLADHLIDNSGDQDQLKMEVTRIWQLIRSTNWGETSETNVCH